MTCFQLRRIHTVTSRQRQVKAANLEAVLDLFDAYTEPTYSVAWIDCLQTGHGFGRSILILGEHATPAEVQAIGVTEPLRLPPSKQVSVPFALPSFVLHPLTIRAFNALYYHKNRKKIQDSIVPYERFFYPLDAVSLESSIWTPGICTVPVCLAQSLRSPGTCRPVAAD